MNGILCFLILCMSAPPTPTPTEAPRRALKMKMESAPTPTPTPPPKQAVLIAPRAPEILIENGAVTGVTLRDETGAERFVPLNPPPVFNIRIEANASSGVVPVDTEQLFRTPVVEVKSQ